MKFEEVLARFRAKNPGDNYDYSEINEDNWKKEGRNAKYWITCIKHDNRFQQTAKSHMDGKSGCKECTKEKQQKSQRTPQEVAVEKLKNSRKNNLYNYDKVVYKGSSTPVEIVCTTHGSFWQIPANHINLKHGCKECGRESTYSQTTKTTHQFIEEAEETHGKKYDYSEVEYRGADEYVKIKCKIHGFFQQVARSHLRGRGCPKCARKK